MSCYVNVLRSRTSRGPAAFVLFAVWYSWPPQQATAHAANTRHQYRRLLEKHRKKKPINPAIRSQLRGLLCEGRRKAGVNKPNRSNRNVQKRSKPRLDAVSRDPTLKGTHPGWLRLVAEGWFSGPGLKRLQRLADKLHLLGKGTKRRSLSTVTLFVVDLETTGLDEALELTQLAYATYRAGKLIKSKSTLVRPDVEISPAASDKTGHTANGLQDAPRIESALGDLLRSIGRAADEGPTLLVGHNILRADYLWLRQIAARLGVTLPNPEDGLLDTLLLADNVQASKRTLRALARQFGIPFAAPHDATHDVGATMQLLDALSARLRTSRIARLLERQEQALIQRNRRQRAESKGTL